MTLYFDSKVEFLDIDTVGTIGAWHPVEPLFAIASYSEERGGSVTIFTDTGEPQHDVVYPVHATTQVSAICWHPRKLLLTTGWENGDIHVWFEGHREFASVHSSHRTPILLIEFSEQGGRLVTADASGLVTGWRCDGQYQFLTMFSHDLRDPLLHITFRRTIESDVSVELANLAKAAVAGDEFALDTLTNWRPRTAARNLAAPVIKDNHCFFVGTQTGLMYYINHSGTCTEVLNNTSTLILQMMWHPKKDAVICLLQEMNIVLYLVETTGLLTELDRVKLSSYAGVNRGNMCWAGNSLAIITGDLSVRIWDIEKNDNYLLKMDLLSTGASSLLQNTHKSPSQSNYRVGSRHPESLKECFTCLAYCVGNQTLCAGTNLGNLYVWRHLNIVPTAYSEDHWQLTNISNLHFCIKNCFWGYNEIAKPCILVNCVANFYVLKEQPLLYVHTRQMWAIQRASKIINLENLLGMQCVIETSVSVTALALSELNVVVSNGRSITTYSIEKQPNQQQIESVERATSLDNKIVVKILQTFNAECLSLHMLNQNIFCLNTNNVIIYSIGGVTLHKILTTEMEGKTIGMDLSSHFLTIFTMNGIIKGYDVSRHDPKVLFPAKLVYDFLDDFGEVISAKCNVGGTHLAILVADRNFLPKSCVYCWNFERNVLLSYELKEQLSGIQSCIPVCVFWDVEDTRLLAVEIKSLQEQRPPQPSETMNAFKRSGSLENLNTEAPCITSKVLIMFHTEKTNLCVLESQDLASGEQLINLCIPNVITLDLNLLREKSLQNFIDLKNCDEKTRKLVLNFSLHVAEGNMDMAYRDVRSLNSPAVWTNLAKMCVQKSRLDVAKVCLGKLGKVRSVQAIHRAQENTDLEPEAKIAVLAIELGLMDEAKEFYRKCERYDLLNKLLQASGQFKEAIKVAETHDRVHLKNTYFFYAQHLKEEGDIKGAIEYFEKTNNPVQNITQILLDNPVALKKYMQNTTDPNMLKWWGQYIESSGDMESALAVYQKAEDWFSQVKIYCYLGNISKADGVARQSGDRAACYHLARHYENVGKFQEAIMFYTRAQTFSNAIRICKENDFQDELWNVASSARAREKTIAAVYFEQCGSFKRAVELYHRAGMLHKALDMAIESEQPEIMEIIAAELTADSDAELINRCVDFLLSIEQYQKSVYLLAKCKHLERALKICSDKGVPITEQLAEMLTPNKADFETEIRAGLLKQLGYILQQQGDYHTATKKFTLAGDKIMGMKCLLKSGNTDKIIFYANMSRQREVYIMAANYLQALNWHTDNNILKHIITFYSKGQAFDSLANFYAICAQIEIEEFQDYEKALKAMHEAAKCLEKITHSTQALNNLNRSIAEVKQVLKIQNALKEGDNKLVVEECRNLLGKAEVLPVRHVHVIPLLIKAFVYLRQYDDAVRVLKELTLRDPDWKSNPLIDRALVELIAKECNLDFNSIWGSSVASTSGEDELDQEIREELKQ